MIDAEKAGQAYVVYTLWDGNTFRGSFVKRADLTLGENEITLPVPIAKSGDTVQICIIDSLTDFGLLTDDIINISL